MLKFKQWLQERYRSYTEIGHDYDDLPTLWIWSGKKLKTGLGRTHHRVFSERDMVNTTYQGRYSTKDAAVSVVNMLGDDTPKVRIPQDLKTALLMRFPGVVLVGFGNVKI